MKYLQPVNANSRPRLEWALATALGFAFGMGVSVGLFILLALGYLNDYYEEVLNSIPIVFIGISIGIAQEAIIGKYVPGRRKWILIMTLASVVALSDKFY